MNLNLDLYIYINDMKQRISNIENKWVKTGVLDHLNSFIIDRYSNKDISYKIIKKYFSDIENNLLELDEVVMNNIKIMEEIKEKEEKERKEREEEERERMDLQKPLFYEKLFNKTISFIIDNLEKQEFIFNKNEREIIFNRSSKKEQTYLFIELPPMHLKTTLCNDVITHLAMNDYEKNIKKIMLLNYLHYSNNAANQEVAYYLNKKIKNKLDRINYEKVYVGNQCISKDTGKIRCGLLGYERYNSFDLIVIDDVQLKMDIKKEDLNNMKNYILSNLRTWLKPNGVAVFINSYYPSIVKDSTGIMGINASLTDLIKEDLFNYTLWKYPIISSNFLGDEILWFNKINLDYIEQLKHSLSKEIFDKAYLLRH